jgi:hypothetical protein
LVEVKIFRKFMYFFLVRKKVYMECIFQSQYILQRPVGSEDSEQPGAGEGGGEEGEGGGEGVPLPGRGNLLRLQPRT